jgi:polyisoprenoid-binding protein YceI
MSAPQQTETNPNLVWVADPLHTQVEFAAKHLGMMTVRGHFADVAVTGAIDPVNHDATSIAVSIQTASIRTNNEQRDNDLRASTFLEVDKHPTITFKSTKVEHKDGDRYTMTGDLTIKGITHPVTLDIVRYGEFNDPRMGHRISYGAETKVSRKDFGMTFNAMLDGRWVVSDEIQILIEGELVERPEG